MSVFLRWENPISKRYYLAYLHQDLFGDWILTTVWGRINSPIGRITHVSCESYELGATAIQRLKTRREQHKYFLRHEKVL